MGSLRHPRGSPPPFPKPLGRGEETKIEKLKTKSETNKTRLSYFCSSIDFIVYFSTYTINTVFFFGRESLLTQSVEPVSWVTDLNWTVGFL